jgi:hypothetical protein
MQIENYQKQSLLELSHRNDSVRSKSNSRDGSKEKYKPRGSKKVKTINIRELEDPEANNTKNIQVMNHTENIMRSSQRRSRSPQIGRFDKNREPSNSSRGSAGSGQKRPWAGDRAGGRKSNS